ncbi:class I SAM-dependent methyltransferase [Candidatus Oscillochloris fontis]|uniref:class I SAM-dependent methyltransferase n=1 Tax=Candidatus Oscillochloris fontis TaxID=2496868 RepID=UPI00101DF8C0|nr:methyltransferase domain-containing protein [Candidatus Oscillochloris fontis]
MFGEHHFPTTYFRRYDEGDDRDFYRYPRLTAHIDEPAQRALGQIFHEEIPASAHIFDLMSSYHTHLPSDLTRKWVVGLGLNEEELRQNTQLNEYIIHDLNNEPHLPFADASFDAALCTVSVQYLTRPIEVFIEVGRILKPGAPFIVSFSNRCFPSKAVHVWVGTSDAQHMTLVKQYFSYAGCFDAIRGLDRSPCRWLSDPLFAVIGRRG